MLPAVLRGLKLTLALVLAVILSAQLILHQHPLIPEETAAPSFPCAVCAFGADPTARLIPLIAFTLLVAWIVSTAVVTTAATGSALLLPSRAPPLAA